MRSCRECIRAPWHDWRGVATRDELRAFNNAFSEALAQQDVGRVVEMYTEDAMLLFHGMPIVRGRVEIERLIRQDLQEGPSTITFESGQVFEDGALVVDVGRYETPTGAGKYVVVYRRGPDGTLRLLVDSATSDGATKGSSP
jgi:ketosteroid isomerase-like protein